jgi:hypothetical protein
MFYIWSCGLFSFYLFILQQCLPISEPWLTFCFFFFFPFSVKALNQARLEASVRAYGSGSEEKVANKWPSPYVLFCGVFLVVSLFEHFWPPLKWFALVAAAAGLPPIVLRSFAAARRLTLDVNILMLIAGKQPPSPPLPSLCFMPSSQIDRDVLPSA